MCPPGGFPKGPADDIRRFDTAKSQCGFVRLQQPAVDGQQTEELVGLVKDGVKLSLTFTDYLVRFDFQERMLCKVSDKTHQRLVIFKYVIDLFAAEDRHPIERRKIVINIKTEFVRKLNEELPVRGISFIKKLP